MPVFWSCIIFGEYSSFGWQYSLAHLFPEGLLQSHPGQQKQQYEEETNLPAEEVGRKGTGVMANIYAGFTNSLCE
jgi:hypothetical protein